MSEHTAHPPRRPAKAIRTRDVLDLGRRLVAWGLITTALPVGLLSYVVFESVVTRARADVPWLTATDVETVLLWGTPLVVAGLPWIAQSLSRAERRVAAVACLVHLTFPLAFLLGGGFVLWRGGV